LDRIDLIWLRTVAIETTKSSATFACDKPVQHLALAGGQPVQQPGLVLVGAGEFDQLAVLLYGQCGPPTPRVANYANGLLADAELRTGADCGDAEAIGQDRPHSGVTSAYVSSTAWRD
jgi:hypothetical protein